MSYVRNDSPDNSIPKITFVLEASHSVTHGTVLCDLDGDGSWSLRLRTTISCETTVRIHGLEDVDSLVWF